VSTLEDIVSEKLRALLQQPIRNRNQRQDVLDLAVIVQANPALNRDQIGAFLLIKSSARGIVAPKSAFLDPEIARRAKIDYEALEMTTRTVFIPFEEALAIVLALVYELPIPEK